MINRQQMELNLGRSKRNFRRFRRQGRMARAHWWFEQMRRAVDEAIEWKPADSVPPDSGSLDLAQSR